MSKVRALSAYEAKYTLCGWAGPELAKEEFKLIAGDMPSFKALSPVSDYKGQRMMLWEFTRKVLGEDTQNFPQEIGDCFPAGTMVRMANGSEKPIENVKSNELVITPKGRAKRVTRTIAKNYVGELVTIRTKGQPRSVSATPDHRMRMVTGGKEEVWMPIGELQLKNRVLLPFCVGDENTTKFDLSEGLIGDFKISTNEIVANRGKNSQPCYRYIELNDKFGWLIGLYLAEGGSTNDPKGRATRIDFNLGSHEYELIEKTAKVIKEVFGINAKILNVPSKPTVTYVRIDNSAVARFIKRLIPANTYEKRIPSFVMTASESVRLSVIQGWIEGDGHERVDGNSAKVVGISVSHGLCQDMFHLCQSLKLKASVNFRKASAARKSAGQVALYGESAIAVVSSLRDLIDLKSDRQPWSCRSDMVQHGFAHPISNIDRTYVGETMVYCLEVEDDHSFIANGYAVHNCVSFGGKNCIEHLQCVEIALNGDNEKFYPIFPPYFYGTSRINIGKGRLGWGDGSLGVWLQDAIKQFGTLRRGESNVPKYSGNIAKQWGTKGVPAEFITEGKQHLVKTTAMVKTAADVANSLLSGYPVAVCSNQGFVMETDPDGFHKPRGSWGHCMTIIGFEDHPQHGLYFIILNSWGDVHGKLKDFQTGATLPVGCLRVKADAVDSMASQEDTYSYSQFNGFPDNSDKLNKILFDLVGD